MNKRIVLLLSVFLIFVSAACVREIDDLESSSNSLTYSENEFENPTRQYEEEKIHVYPKVSVAKCSITKDFLGTCIKECSNMELDTENIIIDIPSHINEIYDFSLSFAPRMKNEEFYQNFKNTIVYLFPDHNWLDSKLKYMGPDTVGLEDFYKDYEELKDKDEGINIFTYENLNDRNDYAHGTFTSPIGNDLAHFCRGEGAKIFGIRYLESYGLNYFFDTVAIEDPSSINSYHLLDKEVRICDAVNYYENYLSKIPSTARNEASNTTVKEVYVFKLNDEAFGFYFWTAAQIEGISIDWTKTGIITVREIPYMQLFGMGSMVKSEEVDFAYGIYNCLRSTITKKYSEVISFQEALRIISEKLTMNVPFKVIRVELVYTPLMYKGTPSKPDDINVQTTAAWKVVLVNQNDNMYYSCYVDASDGTHFRYGITQVGGEE